MRANFQVSGAEFLSARHREKTANNLGTPNRFSCDLIGCISRTARLPVALLGHALAFCVHFVIKTVEVDLSRYAVKSLKIVSRQNCNTGKYGVRSSPIIGNDEQFLWAKYAPLCAIGAASLRGSATVIEDVRRRHIINFSV